ncbi:response regulator transcription factor [Fuchsiella alkaliacetigena]|uniref:response regulator transcription factor n=1 Tax=Fuchsiella alkaliacetigena TaxID=957042 RepID=UPI00200A4EA4|nr:response regulator transcription factor [Fuchsiella alkaliacetigena]MCK8824470.1 response regulator transcription factor [Fuchsiella alkaliacetigena]
MNEKQILIVDDDENVIEILSLYLQKENYDLVVARDGEEAIKKAKEFEIDLIILDIMMPKLDGLEVCKKLRKKSEVPIILLSARGEEFDRVLGLEIGADDYVTKPFSPREVVARVKVILKRVSKGEVGLGEEKSSSELIEYPQLRINTKERKVEVQGEVVKLSPKEYELLLLLAQNPNQVFKRERLCEKVWGIDYYGDMRTVDVHVNWLRDKLELGYISTVWGVGYKFEVPQND